MCCICLMHILVVTKPLNIIKNGIKNANNPEAPAPRLLDSISMFYHHHCIAIKKESRATLEEHCKDNQHCNERLSKSYDEISSEGNPVA